MFISHKYQVIFIHIQKTGGTSIHNFFSDADPDIVRTLPIDNTKNGIKHCFISDIQPVLTGSEFSDYTKFTVVRNPYDRLYSWYLMFKHNTINIGNVPKKINKEIENSIFQFDSLMKELSPYMDSFEDFVSVPNKGFFQRFYANQFDYLKINQKMVMNKVLRFENLSDDFNALAQQLKIDATLPYINQSIKHDYREAYTEKSKKIVTERFQKDLVYFSYKF